MAKLSSEELQAARKRAAEERAREQQRIAEEQALERERAAERSRWLAEAKQSYSQLESVVSALYEEVDKQSRKWPTMPITRMTLERKDK